jgi:SAM-dependent methyltransferase
VTLRDRERETIREFLEGNAELLGGRVLDYGCGQQPYRDIIKQAGGDYVGWDRRDLPASVAFSDHGPKSLRDEHFDAIICTQVIQYVDPGDVTFFLGGLHDHLRHNDGWLLITGPTAWVVNEPQEMQRFTPAGIRRLLDIAGFENIAADCRHAVQVEREMWQVGWWAKGQAS